MPSPDFPTNITPAEAIALQKKLRDDIRLVPLEKPPKTIGGCDMSMNMFAKEGYAGFVTLEYAGGSLAVIGHAAVKSSIDFPYIPGLLSFREIPMLLKAWDKLPREHRPDVLMVDGTGIAHPRRMGIATHIGLILGIPTIGCAKNLLTGNYDEPALEAGSFSYIYERSGKEKGAHETSPKNIIGIALRSKKNVKPIFISPGHLITLEESLEITRHCLRKHRLPEPTRMAHNIMNEYRTGTLK